MTDGTSQGLFVVIAIVIFGIFVGLVYTVFGDVLQPKMVNLFETALNIDVGGSEGTPIDPAPTPESPNNSEERVKFEDENLQFIVTANIYGHSVDLEEEALEKALEEVGHDFIATPENLKPFKEKVRSEILNKPVTYEKIKELKTLDLNYVGIKSLKGLEYATNLEDLNLTYNKEISDLTPLKDLNNMKILILHSTNVTDLTPIKDLISLEKLTIGYSNVTNITALNKLTNLNELHLEELAITDISPLAELTKLKDLGIRGSKNNITDISIMSNFKKLEYLDLANLKDLKNILPLINLPELKGVNLYGIPKNTLEGLEKLKARKEVNITGLN